MPVEATKTVNIKAKLTEINHLRSVHPSRALRILMLESVPDVEEERENMASDFPGRYCKEKIHFINRIHFLTKFTKQQNSVLNKVEFSTKLSFQQNSIFNKVEFSTKWSIRQN